MFIARKSLKGRPASHNQWDGFWLRARADLVAQSN